MYNVNSWDDRLAPFATRRAAATVPVAPQARGASGGWEAAPAPPAAPPAPAYTTDDVVPTREALPENVARRQVGNSQLYQSVGAHGEPVFSDTVAGAQQASNWGNTGRMPSSLDASDPGEMYRRSVAQLRANYPGQTITPAPNAYTQPAAPDGNVMSDAATSRRAVAQLRAAPGGDTAWEQNTTGVNPGDALRMSPQQRQAAINEMLAFNAQKGANPDKVAANRSALAVLDQSPRPGAYDPTGYAMRNLASSQGFGGMNQMDFLKFLTDQQNTQAGLDLKRGALESKNREFDAKRADEIDAAAQKEVGESAAGFNKDNPNHPDARRAAGIQYVLDHFGDPKLRGSNTYRQGLTALQAELRAQGTPGLIGRIWGKPNMSSEALRNFDVTNDAGLFGGVPRVVGRGGYSNTGGPIDSRFYEGSPTLDRLLSRRQNVDALRQILAQQRGQER